MNAQAERLVEALRGDEFTQTRSVLHDDHGYCCLGVACELYRRETGEGEWTIRDDNGYYTFVFPHDVAGSSNWRSSYYMPPPVMRYFGFRSEAGRWADISTTDAVSLVALNDNGCSFKEIADHIEAKQDDLFGSPW